MATEKRTKSTAYMDAATTRDLCRRAQAGDLGARNAVVEGNLRMVHRVAGKYSMDPTSGLTREDLVQEGMIGLMRAIEKYSDQRAAFSTYATIWIKQAIGRALANSDLIRVPVYVGTNVRAERKGVRPAQGVAKLTDASRLAAQRVSIVDSLDRAVKQSKGYDNLSDLTLADLITDPTQDTEREVVDASERERLHDYLRMLLSPRLRTVIEMRFGLTDGRERTLDDVGAVLGVTRERVRQLEVDALTALRVRLARDDEGAVTLRRMLTRKRAA